MESLICNAPAWDAIQLINDRRVQIWDEIVAASCNLDSRRDVIPDEISDLVFQYPGYALLRRIEERIMESWKKGYIN